MDIQPIFRTLILTCMTLAGTFAIAEANYVLLDGKFVDARLQEDGTYRRGGESTFFGVGRLRRDTLYASDFSPSLTKLDVNGRHFELNQPILMIKDSPYALWEIGIITSLFELNGTPYIGKNHGFPNKVAMPLTVDGTNEKYPQPGLFEEAPFKVFVQDEACRNFTFGLQGVDQPVSRKLCVGDVFTVNHTDSKYNYYLKLEGFYKSPFSELSYAVTSARNGSIQIMEVNKILGHLKVIGCLQKMTGNTDLSYCASADAYK